MSYPKHVWDQLKGLNVERLMAALEKDGWEKEPTTGATLGYRHPNGKRVVVHYHPKKTFGAKILKGLLSDIGWDQKTMKKLKLIK